MNYFQKKFEVRWADVDPNMHLRHTAFVDYTDQVRVAYFESKGFSFLDFKKRRVGPVVFQVTSKYFKEVHLSELITINCKLDFMSDDFMKWKITHDIFNQKGELSCTVELEGAWLGLDKRKLIVPSIEIIKALKEMNG